MRKAAEQLYISQPTVSQAISELENYYGVKLFERLSQKIYLTESGEQLLSYARHVVSSFETMDLAMKHAGSTPLIRLGGSVSVGTRLFNDIVDEMERENPSIDIRVIINNTEHIENLLLKSQIDIGIVEGLVKSKDLIRVPLFTDELVVVVGRKHPFYQREEIWIEELEGQEFIAREDASMERNQYEKVLAENSIKLIQKWSSSNTEPIKKAVIAGKGLAIISRLLIENELVSGALKVVPVHGITVKREIQLIYHKDKFLSPQLVKLIELSKNISLDNCV